jgi:putative FmdB family regulatory protein
VDGGWAERASLAVAGAECQPRPGSDRGARSTVPTYQYVCSNPEGKHEFEVVQSFTDPAVTTCPQDGSPVRKVYGSVGVVFKGSGFYRTDSRKAESASSAPAPAKEPAAAKKESSASKESSSSATPAAAKPSSSSSGSGTAG